MGVEDDLYIDMEEFNSYFEDEDPLEVVRKAFYGEDLDGSPSFNPTRNYFKFNGYGNLVSTDTKSYIDYLSSYNIETVCDKRHIIGYIDSEIDELLDALEEME